MLRTRNQLFLLFFFILFQAKSQNLVPNPSFENATGNPPCNVVQYKTDFTNNMQNWIIPTDGTSDIYSSSCLYPGPGSQVPRTGNIMCAIITYGANTSFSYSYREYLQVKLTSPLIIGKKYYAELYVSAGDFSTFGCNNMGIAFSDTQITAPNGGVISFTPQIKNSSIIGDTVNWVKISGTFIANTPAQYLTIGNFNDDANTSSTLINPIESYYIYSSYYYIDDVLVNSICDPHDSSSTICNGSSITLDLNDSHITGWSLASSPNTIISNTPTLLVSPQVTTSYVAHYDCNETSIFEVIVDPFPSFNFGNDTTICEGQSILYDATTEHAKYLWQDGSTNPNYIVNTTGQYSVTITNGCSLHDEVYIKVVKPSTFNFGSDSTICTGENILFDATSSDASYEWQDGSTNPTYTVSDSGYYAVTIKNYCGTTTEHIYLNRCCIGVEIPNLITPNGDGMNETFEIDCYGNGDYELVIYNTWGALVFLNKAYLNNWGAANVSDGIYYYVIKYKNQSINNGWVQVLR